MSSSGNNITDDGAPALPRRLNGRPAACNECRLRKVACDHTYPVCKRCLKRKTASSCIYPAEAPRSERARVATSRSTGSTARTDPSILESPTQPDSAQVQASPGYQSPRNGARFTRSTRVSTSGYLGIISPVIALKEAENSLSQLHRIRNPENVGRVSTGCLRTRQNPRFGDLLSPDREAGLFVLRCLPGQSNEHMTFHPKSLQPDNQGYIHIAVPRIVAGLEDEYGDLLRSGNLEELADALCYNTAQPFRDDLSDPQEWLDQFCGRNIRWESVALLWVYLEGVSDLITLLSRFERRVGWAHGKQSLELAGTCMKYCIELSRRFTDGNTLLLDLCRRKTTVDSNMEGDASMVEWESRGITVAMMLFLGLHAQQDEMPYKPTFCSEYKRRVVAQIFSSDKNGVLFTGRPSLISRRYFLTPLPLDLRDEDLLADEATLAKAVETLDGRGWNTVGGLFSSTVIRARLMTAFVRDELTDIALRSGSRITTDELLNIKARQIVMYAEFPEKLRYDPDDLADVNIPSNIIFVRILCGVDHLQNLFLVERLLLLHGQLDEGDLIITSFALVSLALNVWTHKDRFMSSLRTFDWLLIAYGASAAGILCQELLRPTFAGIHPKDEKLTRSSIVQQLSLLVGFFNWVQPTAPNADLCADCGACIQRVLDYHLNFAFEKTVTSEIPGWDSQRQPDFSFDLLDTFDWLRTEW